MSQNVTAVLGPTNTGKTFYAVKKMLTFGSGIIGFPLRLLARENYEILRKKIGYNNVALITGEEKIIPNDAKFFCCTVESMPESQKFEFVAIDEIQLAANFERGNYFTDRILNYRGIRQTVFLGSSSMENLLIKIFPNIEIIKKPRFSNLKYFGYKNLTRLPLRSAVIAFSQIDVYQIAEKLKQLKGGVSIVTGALSPEARNKQVSLFEKGEVDFIVATDAIGLGLNLDIKFIFFSQYKKFDGIRNRFLTNDEISQIAGRAGRYKTDGFFGTTERLKGFSEEQVKFVENYKYTEVKRIFWRNSDIRFDNTSMIINSLLKKPNRRELILKKDSSDLKSLRLLLSDKKIKKNLFSKKDIKLLWEICGIPDYNKTLDEFHYRFLKKIVFFLIIERVPIPEKWIATQVKEIEKKSKHISEINLKLTQVRTWSYISFKKNWIENCVIYQSKIKMIENKLSNDLHKNLIVRFVDNSLKFSKKKLLDEKIKYINLNNHGEIFTNKKKIGCLEGFTFRFLDDAFYKKFNIYNQKFFKISIKAIIQDNINLFLQNAFESFNYNVDGDIFWKGYLIAKFFKGDDIINPKIKIFTDNLHDSKDIYKIRQKILSYLKHLHETRLKIILKLKYESKSKVFSNDFRALVFSLSENFGHCLKKDQIQHYKKLNKQELNFLKAMGLVNGTSFIYIKNLNECTFKLIKMLNNVFFKLGLKEEVKKKLFCIKNESSEYKKNYKKINKFGFYQLRILKKIYLINYQLYEKLIENHYIGKKKKVPISKKLVTECDNDFFFIRNFAKFSKHNYL